MRTKQKHKIKKLQAEDYAAYVEAITGSSQDEAIVNKDEN